ncbi:uncharacterized protein K02A2.6-like [Neodiprion virginianus]|uniref:uncharacterized protein K02A2.6-like n=1 Tax=Neodiprion virginianus TaxID=2961670 RepID=UPI001EE6F029|nr:uncharacterized protein K02A2.6-like [Neodiprion virginianus]
MPRDRVITTLNDLFRDKEPITRRRIEILNYRYDKATPITEHIDRINRHASDFDRAKLTDDNLWILLLLQSFCYSSENDELKRIALRVVEKNVDASLKDIVAELEAHINVSTSLKMLENPVANSPTTAINAVHAKSKGQFKQGGPKQKPVQPSSDQKCNGCGGDHQRSKCLFSEAVCHECSRKGHIAKVCRSKQKDVKRSVKSASLVTQSLTSVGKHRRKYVPVTILGKVVNLQYDSGSDIKLIGKDEWERRGSPDLVASEIVEHAGGSEFKMIGKFKYSVQALDRNAELEIDVANRVGVNLFGLNAIDSLDLWSVPLSEYENPEIIFRVQSSETPKPKFAAVQIPCRPIPYAIEKPLEEEVQRLEDKGIIERVEFSNWTTPLVIAKKFNSKMRLCADYDTGVNRALIDNRHPLHNVEGIITKLNGNRFFSVLDLSDAFFQLEIAEDHREITTITTPKRLFRFRQLPFGIKTAPAMFQQAMDSMLAGLQGACAYIDDVVVTGSNRQEHDPLVALLQPDDTKGLKLTTAARLKRWALRLLGYDFRIEHIRAQDFGHADALSSLIEKFHRDNSGKLRVASIRAVEEAVQQVRNLSIDIFGINLRDKLRSAALED